MCDPATAQRRLEELVERYGGLPLNPSEYVTEKDYELGIFAALNAACLAEGDQHEATE